jgi:signal transduction histidine kinase/ActR/RegA family two-component response regulator
MKIRTQLVLLVTAVLAPVVLLAAVSTLRLWELQRQAFEQRFLERVTALRLALDRELDGSMGSLQVLGSAVADPSRHPAAVQLRLREALNGHPLWSAVGWLDGEGRPQADIAVASETGPDLPDEATVRAVRQARRPVVSPLVQGASGFSTYVAVPVLRQDRLQAILYVRIDARNWLALLSRYPISERATLTLSDRHGRIIARTLNHDRWVGQPTSDEYRRRSLRRQEDSFISLGLEGQTFYSAFSHLRGAEWVLGTGVPQKDVEYPLGGPTAVVVLGMLIVAGLALSFALLMGRRIANALTSLAQSAAQVGQAQAPLRDAPLPVDEAETVRRALHEATRLLHARERSLNEALQREARSRAEAEHASQSKDQFLAMLGHELRNPISAVKAAIAVLDISGADKPEVGQRARQVVRRQIRHLTDIVNDLLDVARLNSGKVVLQRRLLDLSRLEQTVLDSFSATQRCRHLNIDSQLAPVSVFGDETRLEQVLSNLLDNACKYTSEAGNVHISVQADGEDAMLSVRDTGSGIAPELLPRVFDLFSQGQRTLDRAQGGLGLGLTVVRRLVEMHGGAVHASSDGVDLGTTITVRLPRIANAADHQAASLAHDDRLAARRIVVVEDNDDSRELVSALLRMKGHQVDAAVDGPSGVDCIMRVNPDVALVDVGLPGFDGTEVARRVRRSQGEAHPLLIALTGYGSEEDRRRAIEAGFDAFLVKPFDIHRFDNAVSAGRSADASSS